MIKNVHFGDFSRMSTNTSLDKSSISHWRTVYRNESIVRPELLNLSFGIYWQWMDEIWNDDIEKRRRKMGK